MKIAVVALGKIGLPLAVQFAKKGHNVIGCDVNPKTVELVNAGTEPFPGEAHLDVYMKEVVGSGHLIATTDTTSAVAESQAVVIVVPLFVDNDGVHQHFSLYRYFQVPQQVEERDIRLH